MQIGLAWLNHESAQQHVPSRDWEWEWIGEPELGYGEEQPGGWVYNILPFIEESPVHDLARGLTHQPRRDALTQTIQTVFSMMHSPSKCEPKLNVITGPVNNGNPTQMANQTGYTKCVGDTPFSDWNNFPRTFSEAENYNW